MEIDQEVLTRFIRFGIVGASGMVFDFAITYALKESFGINKFVANSIGFVVAATSNFLFNRMWTFENSQPDIGLQFVKFFLISLMGLAISNLLIYLLHSRRKMNFYGVKLLAIGLVMIWNFSLNYLYTFATGQ